MAAFHYHTTESVTECIIQCRVGVAVPSIPLGELFDCYWLEKIEENIAWKAMIEIYRAAYRHTANKRLIAAMPNKSFDLFDLHWKTGGDTVADTMMVPKSRGRGGGIALVMGIGKEIALSAYSSIDWKFPQ